MAGVTGEVFRVAPLPWGVLQSSYIEGPLTQEPTGHGSAQANPLGGIYKAPPPGQGPTDLQMVIERIRLHLNVNRNKIDFIDDIIQILITIIFYQVAPSRMVLGSSSNLANPVIVGS